MRYESRLKTLERNSLPDRGVVIAYQDGEMWFKDSPGEPGPGLPWHEFQDSNPNQIIITVEKDGGMRGL